MKLLIIYLVLLGSSSKSFTRQNCTSSQIFDPRTLGCVDCPPLMRPNPNQKIQTRCSCIPGYYQNQWGGCAQLVEGGNCLGNQFANVVEDNGMYTFPKYVKCQNCSINAYANQYIIQYQRNGTGCVSCPRYMVYNLSSNSCQCRDSIGSISYIQTMKGCLNSSEISLTSKISISDSIYFEHLKYLLPSCFYFKDLLSCSFLINLCIYSMGSEFQRKKWCQFSTSDVNFPSFLLFDQTLKHFSIKPESFNSNKQLSIKLLLYLPTGNLVKENQIKINEIINCSNSINQLKNLQVSDDRSIICFVDVGNVFHNVDINNSQNYLYEMFIMDENSQYFLVAVYIGQSQTPVKRFFLKDSFSSKAFINVLTSMKFALTINEDGNLISPCLYVSYSQHSIFNQVVPFMKIFTHRSLQGSNASQFESDLQQFWVVFIGVFIAINVIVLIQSIVRTYIAYLNRQSLLGFFYFVTSFWSIWMFYFLIIMSGYLFLLYNSTRTEQVNKYVIGNRFAIAFYVIASLMGFFRVVTVIYDKKQKLGFQLFMINWEKGKNSWREIFIINSLAQFYTYRTVSFFWMLLCLMLFLVGIKEVQESAIDIKNTKSHFNTPNRIYLFFISGSIFLVIGIVFKILRRITVIVWPYPFEDFVDYCNVTNISFVFMKKRSLEAYYLHASIPDKSQVTYKQINDAIRRGLNKNRNIMKQHSFHEGQRMYIFYMCKQLQQKFNNMLKKCQDEKEQKLAKHKSKEEKKKNKYYTNPREEFIQQKLKPYLDAIMREGSRNTKTFFNSFFGMPEVDLRDPAALRNSNYVIFDHHLDIVSEVFPNGNQFEEIHTLIIIFLMFILMTANVCASSILTFFVFEFMIDKWIAEACRQNLQAMTKVKNGFML